MNLETTIPFFRNGIYTGWYNTMLLFSKKLFTFNKNIPKEFISINYITRVPQWVIIIGIILVLLISISGIINIYYLDESHKDIEKINEITALTQSTQIEFEKQFAILHYMLFEKDPEEYRKYFHKFSYQYTIVQNQIFNLKLLLSDFPAIKQKIETIHNYHKELSGLLIDELTQYKENAITAFDVYSIIKNKDIVAIEQLNAISNEISNTNYESINTIKNKYFKLTIISIIIMSIVSLTLVILIFAIIMSEKKYLFDIGRELTSYLPMQLVELILKRNNHEVVPIQKKFITVCFTDIQGFTKLTDITDPETSAEILNEYLTKMAHIAHKYNATVDKFLGDGIMIMFGAPISMTPALQVDNAIKMAIEMQKEFKELNKSWKTYLNGNTLHLRIGIHCGIATVGSFGPQERLSFTAIGKTVNIASRLEQMCKADSILISADVKQLIPNLPVHNAVSVTLKGIEKPIETYSIADN